MPLGQFLVTTDARDDGLVLSDYISILRCPFCVTENALQLHDQLPGARSIENGELRCQSCGKVSPIQNGIWDAMGARRPQRTLAQLSNVVPPVPQLYERLWRSRSLSLLSGRPFPLSEELHEMAAALGNLGSNAMIVDVACSEGLYARTIAASNLSSGPVVFAVDHSRRFLKRVLERRGSGLVVPVRALAQALPFSSATADAMVMGGSLNELGDLAIGVNEFGRLSKDCAPFFQMSLIRSENFGGRLVQSFARPAGITFPTKSETRDLFERAGFLVEGVRVDGVAARLEGHRRVRSQRHAEGADQFA